MAKGTDTDLISKDLDGGRSSYCGKSFFVDGGSTFARHVYVHQLLRHENGQLGLDLKVAANSRRALINYMNLRSSYKLLVFHFHATDEITRSRQRRKNRTT